MMEKIRLRAQKPSIDLSLLIVTAVLTIFGLVMIYDASVVSAFRDFGDKLHYFKNQLIWVTVGTIALVTFSLVDYHKLISYSHIFFLGSMVLLVLVLIPHVGTEVYGARRWINVGGLTFQPSEFAKLSLIFYQTAILSKFQSYKIRLLDSVYVLFLPTFMLTGLVLLGPDMGTALIFIAITLTTYFIGGGPILHFIVSVPLLAASAFMAIFLEPYRINRLKSFMDPSFDPQGASYQINQILTSLASGGLLGTGIGGSRGKFDFIPEVQTDAIFSVIAEELGFIGSLFLIFLFLFLTKRVINIAGNAKDFQGRTLAGGILVLLTIQAFFNIASNVALTPLTGIPLPFISSGGSSLVVTMSSIGILLNISRQS